MLNVCFCILNITKASSLEPRRISKASRLSGIKPKRMTHMNDDYPDNSNLVDLYLQQDCLVDKIMLLSVELAKVKEKIQLKQEDFNGAASDV